MSPFLKRLERHFIWRRAFRSGDRCVVRADLMEAFGISGNKASALLTEEANDSKGRLVRTGYKISAPLWAEPPRCAGEEDLMEHLDRGLTDFEFTGLRPDEMPVNQSAWRRPLPHESGALFSIVRAITTQTPLFIRYVGMEYGDTGRWRRVVPLSLDCVDDQWRLSAQSLDNAEDNFPVRSFVLSRILESRIDTDRPPARFVRASGFDSASLFEVKFHEQLTAEQRQVIGNELSISDGSITLPARTAHDFFRRFGDAEVSAKAVWPPVRLIPPPGSAPTGISQAEGLH